MVQYPNKVSYKDFGGSDSNMSRFIVKKLNTSGYVIISDFNIDVSNTQHSSSKLIEICELVGFPIPHNSDNSIIWNIKSNHSSSGNGLIKTYSEHMHDAELHTDSQYSYYPEDYFSLLMLKPASCGGGESMILSLQATLKELRATKEGKEAENILRGKVFPFIVPNVFKRNKNSKKLEFNFGHILSDNEIRFRIDTFEKAIELRPDLCDSEQLQAYNILKNIIINSPSIERFHLKERDLVFINNKTVLHGRTSFRDVSRHLLRIRMNKHERVISLKLGKSEMIRCK